jgi:hypothetical protein
MKKSSFRFFLLSSLMVISLASYVYLSTRDTNHLVPGAAEHDAVLMQEKDAEGYLFPDIETIKKVVSAVRQLLPAS